MLHLTNGRVTGCSKQGHSTIFCEDCMVENCQDKSSNQYEQAAQEIALLVTRKQKEYGNSFGNADKIMKVLYPTGISLDQMKDALVVVRIVDKLFRIANGDQGSESAFSDINGYSLLAIVRNKNES
jgi:hypothetical protein